MRNAIRVGIKPKNTRYANPPEGVSGSYFPLAGGGAAAINISAVIRGYPTVVRLGSLPAVIAGQYIKIASAGGITELNGYHRVLGLAPSNSVVLDVDSTNFTPHTSGGTLAHNVLYDVMGTLPPQDWQGTTTGLYSNQLLGTTPNTGGTNTEVISSVPDAFNLSGFEGILYIGGLVQHDTSSAASQQFFSLGRREKTNANSASGTVTIGYAGAAAQLTLVFRPQTLVDGAGTNVEVNTGALTNDTTHHVGWLIDCRNPAAPFVIPFLDAVQKTAVAANMSNAIGLPNGDQGLLFGGTLNASLVISEKWGAATNVPKLRNWAWLKLDGMDAGDAYSILRRHSQNKELVL